MQKASEGISLTELMEDLDSNLTYGGAKKISEGEAELLDQLDENFAYQLSLKSELERAQKTLADNKKELEELHSGISEYCSETTMKKILLKTGWQFREEEAKRIKEAPSDKELVDRINENNGKIQQNIEEISMQEVVENAIAKGITHQDVTNVDISKRTEKSETEVSMEGETKDD